MEQYISDNRIESGRKAYGRMALSLFVIAAGAMILSIIFTVIVQKTSLGHGAENMKEILANHGWVLWIVGFLPLYLAAPIGISMMKKIPASKMEEHSLSMGKLIMYFFMSVPILFAGTIISNVLQRLISGTEAINPLEVVMDQSIFIKALFLTIVAPILEEYIFRKTIIDRTVQYGEKWAIFFSGLTFGLFHINLFQFFFAFGIGLFFAYIYVRTGRLRYVIALHIGVNFMGSIIAPLSMSGVDPEELDAFMSNGFQSLSGTLPKGILPFLLYLAFFFLSILLGIIFWITQRKTFFTEEKALELPKGSQWKTIFLNGGMISFLIFCTIFILRSILKAA